MIFLIFIGLCVFWTGIWTGAFLMYWFNVRETTNQQCEVSDEILIENDAILDSSYFEMMEEK